MTAKSSTSAITPAARIKCSNCSRVTAPPAETARKSPIAHAGTQHARKRRTLPQFLRDDPAHRHAPLIDPLVPGVPLLFHYFKFISSFFSIT
jgi:hypothetical protein